MDTIFTIDGGMQKARQNVMSGLPIKIQRVENSDWKSTLGCSGQHSYTNVAWDTDLDSLKKECVEWCRGYGEISFSIG